MRKAGRATTDDRLQSIDGDRVALRTPREAQSHEPSVPEMARYLQDLFGQKLTALMVGTGEPREIGRWARDEARPDRAIAGNLRNLFEVAQLLRAVESEQAVQAWFVGMNAELDERSPAEIISEAPQLVLEAARIFVATG
jgi:hypothetical protein